MSSVSRDRVACVNKQAEDARGVALAAGVGVPDWGPGHQIFSSLTCVSMRAVNN